MADISKITLPNGSSYDIKDATARSGLDGKAASSHTHDDRYYTESEINTKLNGKANTSHGNHVPATQTANNAVFLRNDNTWQTVTPANIGAATTSHTHDALYALKSKYGDTTINVGRKPDTTIGAYSTAEGYQTTASGEYSHAEGNNTKASAQCSHAEGGGTTASGTCSHAEGGGTTASSGYSHAEGSSTTASGNNSHSEGNNTTASGLGSHAEGSSTTASGEYSHAEGNNTTASGNFSHSEGSKTTANGLGSHAEGSNTDSAGSLLSDRTVTISDVDYTITGSTAYGINSHAEGTQSFAYGYSSHAEGYQTTASGEYSHAEGHQTTASGSCSHAEGQGTKASFNFSHAEGSHTTASGASSHAEGSSTTASGLDSHAEGSGTTASGNFSHAEGHSTKASGNYSHAGGFNTTASGEYSFSHGDHTKSINNQEASFGKYNKSSSDTLFSVGDGTADNARHNAFEITTTGGKLHDKDIATTDLITQIIEFGSTETDTKTAIGQSGKTTIYRCVKWIDYPSACLDGQGTVITINYGGTGTAGVDSMWAKQIFITAHGVRSGAYIRWIADKTIGKWEEISTTPIKSTGFSKTVNETGSFTLWQLSENKVPIFIQLNNQGFYAVPFLYQNQWWLGSTIHEVTRQPVPNVTVSGTIYYIEI